jgi:hypothetical protein
MSSSKKPQGQDIEMTDGNTSNGKIAKLNVPKEFDGDRKMFEDFYNTVELYLHVNRNIYKTEEDKISFVLSLMTEGDARTWKSQFQANARKTNPYTLGTWADFSTNLTKAFEPFDAPGDALEELKLLRRKENHIEDHVATFRRLAQAANLDKDSPTVRDLFEDSLDTPLLRKMYSRGASNVPKTIEEWYKQAIEEDNAKGKLARRIARRNEGRFDKNKDERGKKKEFTPRQFTFAKRDPNAMDVDALTTEKKEEMMKKGLCFTCGDQGHLSRNCPKKGKPAQPAKPTTSSNPPAYSPKKMDKKELLTHIRTLTALMDEQERDEFYDEAEKEGF